MSARLEPSHPSPPLDHPREPLAVVGIGCRFPGGIDSPTTFWSALLDGLDAIRDVPEDRWKHSRFHDTSSEKSGYIRNAKGGFLDSIDQFDGEFFGYFPAEAQRIDPQQRFLLEVTHEAMEDAGLRRDQLDGSRTAVFIGSFMYDYLCMQTAAEQRDEINPYVAMGTAMCSLANRISYVFNLTGPSVSLDTACSSSLTALHLACQSMWRGESEMAIAGGVSLMMRPESSIMMSKAGFLNPDQYCKAFDESANGYVRSEGAAVVLLKPLAKAIADGDDVYACVHGTAVNQDGHTQEGFTVPNVFSQVALLETVYDEAGIDPLTVDFVEAHGPGTPVGDPIESAALGSVMGFERSEDQPNLIVGSVKTNLGHLEGAAGIAGFIKAVLTANRGVAPPNLHFHQPNLTILWDHYRLEVPTQPTPLTRSERPLTVGVNSFGAGGANAHVVLRQTTHSNPDSRQPTPTNGRASRPTLYALSARNREALRTLALRHADFLSETEHCLDDIAFSAFTRRSHYPQLLAVVGESARDVEERLRKFADGQVDPETLAATMIHEQKPKLAFVFSGQGGQWARMGLQLMQCEPVFRNSMQQVDALFGDLAGWSLLDELQKQKAESRINDTVVVQPAVMAIQVALVQLYEHYGIRPEGIVGHSIGEVAAAFAAGALTLEQAVQVIYHRSQAQDRVSGKGGMLAVGLSLEDARDLIEGYDGRVSIGAVNGPEMLTLSGDTEPLGHIAEMLEERGVFCRSVRVQVAYHSHHIELIEDLMLETLADVRGVEAAVPLFSTVTGGEVDGTHLTAEYWYQNAREPVLFTDALSAMLKDRFDTFIEIGPHPVLVGGGEALIKALNLDAVVAPAMTRREPEVTVFLQSLARLAGRGFEPNTDVMFGRDRRYVRLPKNPWQHSRYWFESPAAEEMRRGRFEHPFLKRQTQLVVEEGLAVWDVTLDPARFPYLRDHQVDGEIVFPATGHMELAWAVASEQSRHDSFFLENLQFDLPLVLPANARHPLEVRLEIVSGEGDYQICSRPADERAESTWAKHSSGRINAAHDRFEQSTASLDSLQRQFQQEATYDCELFYERLHEAGLGYGERFCCVEQLQYQGHHWLAKVRLPDELKHESMRNNFHPALLDACLHVVFADTHIHGDPQRIYLPYRIDRVRFYKRPTQTVWSHVRVTRSDEQYLCSNSLVFDEQGELVAELFGITCKRLAGAGSQQIDSLYEGCFEYNWLPAARDDDRHGRVSDTSCAVLVGDASAAIDGLAARLATDDVDTLTMRFSDTQRLDELLEDVALDRRTLIVFVAAFTQTDWNGLADCPSVPALLQVAQALQKREGVPRFVIVTSGAANVAGDQDLDLSQAILHGMARVINNECPTIPVTVIDLSAAVSPGQIDALYHELSHSRRDLDESEIALRGDDRYVRQLVTIDRDIAEQAAVSTEAGVGGGYRADLYEPGMLDQIVFRRLPPSEVADEDVEIAVEAAALNFKDIMNAMGLLPENAVAGGLACDRLGLEVAGRVMSTGRFVKHVQTGDHVIARVSDGFSGRVTTPGHCVVRRPKSLTAIQAAAVPVVYITAWYSLHHLARMARGETVLIHSAAGGVGGAAIQLARLAGANVIVTAGTKDKRDYLRGLGVEHVFDSRSLDFSNKVMEVTSGRGVDIVLNFLTGRFIPQSMKCLAPFGRFIELGKSDIYNNSKLSLERLGENISYFVVDVDRLAAQKPELHQHTLNEVVALFERGGLEPHEITEFPITKLSEAMKFMTRAAYKGKIVMNMQGDRVPALPPRHVTLCGDRSYLISGGASGFGLEIAEWMVNCGARHLVLLSRSGCKTRQDEATVNGLRALGIDVVVKNADVTDANAVQELVQQIELESPPLAGVIHGAAVLDDASLQTMDMERFQRVFQPKAQGAWNLHKATQAAGSELDFFVMLSSISSVLGLVGQLNYAAANYFQDALANYRRQQGLRATSVNLGVLGEYAGMSNAENDQQGIVSLLESQGMFAMPLAEVLSKLEAALVQQPTERMTARIDWPWFRMAYPHLAQDSRFIHLLGDAALAEAFRPKGSGLRTELAEMEPEHRLDRLQHELASVLARILDADPAKIDVATSLDTFGLDSLMLTELRVSIVRAFDVNLPLIKLLKGPSLADLAVDVLAQLESDDDDDAVDEADDSQGSSTFVLADLDEVKILNPWLIRGGGDVDAPFRLICFHSMAVGASLFTNFLRHPPNGFDILAVQTPGRENRQAEPVMQTVDELADQIVPQLEPFVDRPVVIWGHSYGGIVAVEVIRRLRERKLCEPLHFVVTGTIAPHLVHHWQNREVILRSVAADINAEYMIAMSRFVDNPEFLRAILPGFRRDYPLLKSYRFQPLAPLNCSITAFAAQQDDVVYTDEISAWSQHTLSGLELIEVDGDHWFIDRNRELITTTLQDIATAHPASQPDHAIEATGASAR